MKRIFISSTFKDMQYERDLFHKSIAPRINQYAYEEYGETVLFCDLRWGVDTYKLSEEDASKKVLSVCLSEIDKCYKTGSLPYIVVLIGDRYGSIPKKEMIDDAVPKNTLKIEEPISITALEIEYGALRDSDRLKRTLFYFRSHWLYVAS
jgi:hypothetical protein